MTAPLPPVRRPDLIFRKVDDDIVVYDPIRDHILLLNSTSALILDLCDGSRSWAEIEAEIAGAFPVDRAVVAQDVEEVRRQFRRAGLFRSGTGG